MHKDSIARTIGVAVVVCVACSVIVSSAAVGLRSRQHANQVREQMVQILAAAGLPESDLAGDTETLKRRFDQVIETRVVDLATGERLSDVDPASIDPRKEARNPATSTVIAQGEDLAGIKRRANRQAIYLYRKDGRIERIILPVYGKGLWSTMYGYLALSSDAMTIERLAFYEHAETPGLGGEIDNPRWKAQWVGKKAFDDEGEPRIEVIKGVVDSSSPQADYQVDGISGATITGRGVMNLVRYWLGEQGYGPVLEKLQETEGR
ncbi:MAG TPA: Na(+)-translocating NADH-quinone reductase subunit C [Planctomycetaceae bacterium]|nr:Na(+)-translocating NADH-quinone reductase subunit C [Planctomycetaceae bacterium]